MATRLLCLNIVGVFFNLHQHQLNSSNYIYSYIYGLAYVWTYMFTNKNLVLCLKQLHHKHVDKEMACPTHLSSCLEDNDVSLSEPENIIITNKLIHHSVSCLWLLIALLFEQTLVSVTLPYPEELDDHGFPLFTMSDHLQVFSGHSVRPWPLSWWHPFTWCEVFPSILSQVFLSSD